MAARIVYKFESIAAGQTTSVFIWGYTNREAVNYSAAVYGQYPAPYPAQAPPGTFPSDSLRVAHVTITQGETFRWSVNGTIARKVYVQNHYPYPVGVEILQFSEKF